MIEHSFTTRKIDCFNPNRIALSGQCFRWSIIDDTHVELIAFGEYLQIAYLGDSTFAFSCYESDFSRIWEDYFDLNRDYISVIDSIDPEDSYLTSASSFSYGIRILKQEPFETMISYIISQRRSIPSITTCVERLCRLCARKIILPALCFEASPFTASLHEEYYAFPEAKDLNKLTFDDISSIGAGYRTDYIMNATKDICSGRIDLTYLYELSDDKLYEALISMRGIGAKVANCIMLFGYSRTSRFPIDVWMSRIVEKNYGGSFDTSKYPDTAGIMQQFMFFYERNTFR